MRRGTRRLPTLVGLLVVLTSLPFATPVAAAGSVSLTTIGSGYPQDFTTAGGNVCGSAYTPIHDIQGNGAATPIAGNVSTEGIVVGDFEGPLATGIQGFYIQEPSEDANPATSEGIFVYTGNTDNSLAAGDRVRVSGYARERFSQTTINGSNSDTAAVSDIVTCSTGNALPAPVVVALPFASADAPEAWEGMYVKFTETLVIAEYFNYDRFGEIVLAKPLTGEARPFSGTAVEEPGAPANSRTAANMLRRITLDDAVGAQNPPSVRHPNGSPFSLTNYFRGGDTVTDAIGVLGFEFSLYRLYPTAGATYAAANPRPSAPADTEGRLTVAAQNALNFFLTLDETGGPNDNKCGPAQNVECRGADADQPNEFSRQRDKLLATLAGLDADVIGLNEIENTTGVDPLGDPTRGIVAGLNAMLGAGTYSYINTGTIGTDAIKVGLIYRTAKVTPVGSYAILNSTVDPRFIDTKSRPVLAQTFQEIETGAKFTVAVNHLKSKGSACTDIGDNDAGDGQGNCNGTRTLAAQALVDWLATDPTSSGDPDFLIIGDLNSYAMEDPIDAIKAGPDDAPGTGDDYTNLVKQFLGTYAYSYVFDGQNGYLDHALSSPTMTSQVSGVAEWHINADEADLLDYDTSFKPPAQDALYEPAAYRSSDHDGVIVGLNLEFDSAPEITSVTGTAKAVRVRSNRSFQASWTDADADDTFTTTWDWDDGSPNTVHTPGSTSDTAIHKFQSSGFYRVTFTVTDADGMSDSQEVLVIVWDRSAGYVTGGLTFPDGSLSQMPSVKYQSTGAPTGKVTIHLPGATIVSKKLKWLVVDGDTATYAGRGTRNGAPGYTFYVSLHDGGAPGTQDSIRVLVLDSGGNLVYDSQPGDAIDAAPTTSGTGGDIVVH